MRRGATILALAMAAAAGLAACQGCRAPDPATPVDGAAATEKPTARLVVMSTIAGALEPCGCSKNQLGGFDHFAKWLAGARAEAPTLAVAAGPTFFLEPELKKDDATQATWKAEAIADAAKGLGLAAFAPGLNDWAAGGDELAKLAAATGAKMLAGNLTGAPAASVVVREVGGLKVGLVGVATPKDRAGKTPPGVTIGPAAEALGKGIEEAEKQGADVLVALAAMPRGEALRLVDAFPSLHVLVVGKPVELGDANDAPKTPEIVGKTVVVETSNHLQTVAVVDLHVRDGAKKPIVFADAGIEKAGDVLALQKRVHDLEVRIDRWENDTAVKPEDLAARKGELEKLRGELAKAKAPAPAPPGSFVRYQLVEVRAELGSDPATAERMLGYYKHVNEHNKAALADRLPPPPEAGKAGYVGTEACATCHEDAKKVWDGTPHAHAYATLQKQFKEYNLDCVSCHVTGYDKPGGSTVTHVEKLVDVGCEVCHGPGSLHVKRPEKKDLVVAKPGTDLCLGCHHPPHVEAFDPAAKLKRILGPGHGA